MKDQSFLNRQLWNAEPRYNSSQKPLKKMAKKEDSIDKFARDSDKKAKALHAAL